MAVPNRVLVLRLHRDFEEPNVYIAILEAFQKLGYDRPTHCCAKFRGGTRYFHHATDGEWQVIALCYSTLRFRQLCGDLLYWPWLSGSSLPKHDFLQGNNCIQQRIQVCDVKITNRSSAIRRQWLSLEYPYRIRHKSP